jgi:hypothetical protein
LGLAYNNDKTISKESMFQGATNTDIWGIFGYQNRLCPLVAHCFSARRRFPETSTDANGSSTYGNKVSMYHRYTAVEILSF